MAPVPRNKSSFFIDNMRADAAGIAALRAEMSQALGGNLNGRNVHDKLPWRRDAWNILSDQEYLSAVVAAVARKGQIPEVACVPYRSTDRCAGRRGQSPAAVAKSASRHRRGEKFGGLFPKKAEPHGGLPDSLRSLRSKQERRDPAMRPRNLRVAIYRYSQAHLPEPAATGFAGLCRVGQC